MKGIIIVSIVAVLGIFGLGWWCTVHTNIEGTVVEKAFTKGETSVGTAISSNGNVHTVVSNTYDEFTIYIDGDKFNVSGKEYFKIDKGDYVKIRKGKIVEIVKKGDKDNE